jgi:hypothetical protein
LPARCLTCTSFRQTPSSTSHRTVRFQTLMAPPCKPGFRVSSHLLCLVFRAP